LPAQAPARMSPKNRQAQNDPHPAPSNGDRIPAIISAAPKNMSFFLSFLRVEHDILKIYSGRVMRKKIRKMQQVTRSETAKRKRFYRKAAQSAAGKSLRRWFMW
jgi:hypothetical protein